MTNNLEADQKADEEMKDKFVSGLSLWVFATFCCFDP